MAGTILLVSPLASVPALFRNLTSLIYDKWPSKDSVKSYIQTNEENGEKHFITMIHAEDDYDMPWQYTRTLFWHAVNATTLTGVI